MQKLQVTKPNPDEFIKMMDMNQVIDDYQQTPTLKATFLAWSEALENNAKKHNKNHTINGFFNLGKQQFKILQTTTT